MSTAVEERNQRRWARQYETIYILRPDIDPDDADKVAQRVREIVERLDGKLTKVDNWGKRKLAYAIGHYNRGIFVHICYVGFNDVVQELERNLRLLDDVIRHQTVKLGDMIDPTEVQVDPEEVKFIRVEPTEDEEEPGIEQRLGFASQQASAEAKDESGEGEEGEEAAEGEFDEGDVGAPTDEDVE